MIVIYTRSRLVYPSGLLFLGCVLIAGIYGAITVQRTIFYDQGLPALIAIISIYLSGLL